MSTESARKVRREHLRRDAFIYVRHNSVWKIMSEYFFWM